MALPLLPGNVFDKNLGKVKYHKSHMFDICNEQHQLVGYERPGIGGEQLPFQIIPAPHSSIPPGSGFDLPAWVAFDKQVLSFDGYFQESVNESRLEQYRVRHVKVYMYLEDDSIHVVEPRLKNAGLPQGTITRRHRVPKPAPDDEVYYRADDLNIGVELNIHGRVIKLVNCDQFTRNFLQKLGVRVNPSIQIPADPYMVERKAMEETQQPLRPYDPMDKLKQFLDHDRHVLRFYCYWDDRVNMFGDVRYMILHYYLSDDTIEVIEQIPPNAGRENVPTFVYRQRVPKAVPPMPKHGEVTPKTVLNVFGDILDGYSILDRLNAGALRRDFYRDCDLSIGAVVNIFNHQFVLFDCDDFTKEYYRVKYGITDFTPLKPVREDKKLRGPRMIPPFNGFGSEEDSLGNCLSMIPKPPQRDFVKFVAHDRRGLDSNELRFTAKMVTDVPVDRDRRFIISYFRTDDTILVFEPPVRNSGFKGGKFLERGRVKKPNQPRYPVEFSKYFTLCDMYIGAVLDLNKFKFQLIDADDYAYTYLEKHADEFSQSDIQLILGRLKAVLEPRRNSLNYMVLEMTDMPFDEFCGLIRNLVGHDTGAPGSFSDHDIVTLARFYQARRDPGLTLDEMLAIAHDQLKKASYEDFEYISDQCLHHDGHRTGILEQHTVRSVLKALRVPIQNDLMRTIVTTVARPEDGMVDYARLAELLNWRCNHVPPIQLAANTCTNNWQGNDAGTLIHHVNVLGIMQDIDILRPMVRDPCDPEPPAE